MNASTAWIAKSRIMTITFARRWSGVARVDGLPPGSIRRGLAAATPLWRWPHEPIRRGRSEDGENARVGSRPSLYPTAGDNRAGSGRRCAAIVQERSRGRGGRTLPLDRDLAWLALKFADLPPRPGGCRTG